MLKIYKNKLFDPLDGGVTAKYIQYLGSRSMRACELKFGNLASDAIQGVSRSMRACELKLSMVQVLQVSVSHAPCERVS